LASFDIVDFKSMNFKHLLPKMESIFEKLGDGLNNNIPVVLPCEPEKFGEFVSSLLGKPQTISGKFIRQFEVRRETIIDIFHLVDQRVSQQNHSTLIQFTVNVSYDDGSTVLLNSLDDFETYREIRPVVSTGVSLSWTYLIKFNNKEVPEKQQIDISFAANGTSFEADESGMFFIHGNRIIFRINHTARTWGGDIESLLTNYIKTFCPEENKYRKIIRKYSEKIGLFAGLVIVTFSLIIAFFTTDKFLMYQKEKAAKFISDVSELNSDARLIYITQTLSEGAWHRFFLGVIFIFLISIIGAVIIGIWVESAASKDAYSFILLTVKAEERKKKLLNKTKRNFVSLIGSFIASLFFSLIVKITFHIFFENWLK
jgi:hypothetical protein